MRGDECVTFELSALMDIAYSGDARMGKCKTSWDHIIRNLRSPLTDRDLASIFVNKRRTSEGLKPRLEYYDRLNEDHIDRTYRWVCRLVGKLARDARRKRNMESVIM